MGVGQMPVRAALQRLAAEGARINVPDAGQRPVPAPLAAEFDDLMHGACCWKAEAAERGRPRLDAGANRRAARLGAPTWPRALQGG